MNQEANICEFCRQEKAVNRQYLHAKNKPSTGDGFKFIYYCNDCGIEEIVLKKEEAQVIKKILKNVIE